MILPVFCLLAIAVTDQPMPALKGGFLSGREAVLPSVAKGKVALVAMGFSRNSEYTVEAWIKVFRQDFGKDSRITFFEVPMIGGFGRLAKWFIDGSMRKATPKDDLEHVITVYSGTDPWKKGAHLRQPDDAYLLLLDRDGIIRWTHSGVFDAAVYQELAAKVKGLL